MTRHLLAALAALALALVPAGAAAQLLLRGAGSGGFSGYVLPDTSTGKMVWIGDSRGDSAGVSSSSGAYSIAQTFGADYSSFLQIVSGNVLVATPSSNYALASSTSANTRANLSLVSGRCNGPGASATSAWCFTAPGAGGTRPTGGGTSGLTAVVVSSGTGITNGMYAFSSTNADIIAGTTVASGGGTVNLTMSAANNQTFAARPLTFSAAATTPQFWLYGGLNSSNGYAVTDPYGASGGNGAYSPCTDPANIVFAGTMNGNDASLTAMGGTSPASNVGQAVWNNKAILDAFGPSACNKLVILADELPRGLGTAMEFGTVNGSHQVTVVNSGGNFYDDVRVYYAPNSTNGGAGTPNTLGSGDGTQLVSDGVGCGSPAAGHYCVSSTGVYTFNAADDGKQLQLYYRYRNNAGGQYQWSSHYYLKSNASNFVDPDTSADFQTPGALFGRPWVVSAQTFEATYDVASGTSYFPNPWIMCAGGVHLCPYGERLVAQTLYNAYAAVPGVNLTPKFTAPTQNNPQFTARTLAPSGAGPGGVCDAGQDRSFFLTAGAGNIANVIGAINTAWNNGAGTVRIYASTGGIPAGTLVTCVDTSGVVIRLAAAATTTVNPATIVAVVDTTSFMGNGLFDDGQITTTAVTNCNSGKCGTPSGATQGYPFGWTFTLGANDNTALTAGTMGFNYGVTNNALGTGYDTFRIELFGKTAATSGLTATLTYNLTAPMVALLNVGSKYAAYCKVRLAAGPNGTLWGLTGARVRLVVTPGGAFTPPGAPTTFTSSAGSIGDATSGYQFTPKDIEAGALTMEMLSTPVDTTGMGSITAAAVTVLFTTDAAVAGSVTADVLQCAVRAVN